MNKIILISLAVVSFGFGCAQTTVPSKVNENQVPVKQGEVSDEGVKKSTIANDAALGLSVQVPEGFVFVPSHKEGVVWMTVRKENDIDRIEVWDLSELEDRPYGIETESSQNEIDNYVPKNYKDISVGNKKFGVNYLFNTGDTAAKIQLDEIVESIRKF